MENTAHVLWAMCSPENGDASDGTAFAFITKLDLLCLTAQVDARSSASELGKPGDSFL